MSNAQYGLWDTQLGNSTSENVFAIILDFKLNMSQQRNVAAKKGKCSFRLHQQMCNFHIKRINDSALFCFLIPVLNIVSSSKP